MISIIIPWADQPSDAERKASFQWNLRRFARHVLPESEVVLAAPDRLDNPGVFDRAVALNRAVARAKGDILVICDADSTYAEIGDFAEAIRHAKEGSWTLPGRYVRIGPRASAAWIAAGPGGPPPENWANDIEQEYPFANSGVVVMPRAAFDVMGGFEERIQGWGGEDDAMRGALETLWGAPVRTGIVLHLWHPRLEEWTTGQPSNAANRVLADRYGAASGDRRAMLDLIAERPRIPAR